MLHNKAVAMVMRHSRTLWAAACVALFSAFALGSSGVFAPAEPQAPQRKAASNQLHSVKGIARVIAGIKAENAKREKDAPREKSGEREEEEGGLDYLEGLQHYLRQRAYPFDTVDWDAWTRASSSRDRMAAPFRPMATTGWEFLGPKNLTPASRWAFGPHRVSGRVNAVAFHPTQPFTFFAGASGGGVWKTTDRGSTWTPLADGWEFMPVSAITVDPNNGNVIYVGTGDYDGFGGYAMGIMKSTDGGQTWNNFGRMQFGNYAVRRILVDPENSQIVTVVAGRGQSYGGKVWRSTNGGVTWDIAINTNLPWSDAEIGAKDGSGNRYYWACGGGSAGQVWRSADRGASWTQLTTPLRTNGSFLDTVDIAASPTEPQNIYLLGVGDRKIWKSTNAGGTWTDVTTGFPNTVGGGSNNWSQGWYDFYISCSTRNSGSPVDVLYVGLLDIAQSLNAGTGWRSIGGPIYSGSDLLHTDQHAFVPNPNNPNEALVGNDGGVYLFTYDQASTTWVYEGLNTALSITEFYKADFHPTELNRMIGGTQDNGTPGALGDLFSWRAVSGGDGGSALINPSNPSVQYSTYQYLGGRSGGANNSMGMNRTTNAWTSSNWIGTSVGDDRIAWMAPVVMDPLNPSVLYFGTNYLWKYTDTTNSWTPRLGGQKLSTNSVLLSIAVAKSNSNVIYTGSEDNELWMTTDGGGTWTRINFGTPSLPNRSITAISVSDTNPHDVLVGLSGTGSSHLFRCFNTAAATRVWTDVSSSGLAGLPDIPLNTIARDPFDGSTWYVGTDVGVFRTNSSGLTWENITQPLGLPNVRVDVLKAVPGTGYLYAATYGRGMWRLKIVGSALAGLTVSPSLVIGGSGSTGTVTLSSAAPPEGIVVSLSSDNGAATVPESVTVPGGQSSATFSVTTTAVASTVDVNIKASYDGVERVAVLTVRKPSISSLTLNPTTVMGGTSSQGTVTLDGPAPAGGAVVSLGSTHPVATVPATLTIPAGQTSGSFTVTTTTVTSGVAATITATYSGSSQSQVLNIVPFQLASLTLSKQFVYETQTVTGTVALNGPAPAGGVVVSLSSSNTAAATAPSTVTIPAGSLSASFAVTTKKVVSALSTTIAATYKTVTRTAALTVNPVVPSGVVISPNSVLGGGKVNVSIQLSAPSPTGGMSVNLSSSNPGAAPVPATLSISAGKTSGVFVLTTKPVPFNTIATITASRAGTSASATMSILSPDLISLTLSKASVRGGSKVTGTVRINGPAPVGGISVSLSSSNFAATVPPNVVIPAGKTSANFTVTTAKVTSNQVAIIRGSLKTVTLGAQLTVTP